jgi:hypothetical protein
MNEQKVQYTFSLSESFPYGVCENKLESFINEKLPNTLVSINVSDTICNIIMNKELDETEEAKLISTSQLYCKYIELMREEMGTSEYLNIYVNEIYNNDQFETFYTHIFVKKSCMLETLHHIKYVGNCVNNTTSFTIQIYDRTKKQILAQYVCDNTLTDTVITSDYNSISTPKQTTIIDFKIKRNDGSSDQDGAFIESLTVMKA